VKIVVNDIQNLLKDLLEVERRQDRLAGVVQDGDLLHGMIKEDFTFLTVATDVPKVTCGASCSRVDEGTAVLAGDYSILLIGWVLPDGLGSG